MKKPTNKIECSRCNGKIAENGVHLCGASDEEQNALAERVDILRMQSDYDIYGNKVWFL